jgi:hypothetical protein
MRTKTRTKRYMEPRLTALAKSGGRTCALDAWMSAPSRLSRRPSPAHFYVAHRPLAQRQQAARGGQNITHSGFYDVV